MRPWENTSVEATELYSPIGLRLLDDLTRSTPIGNTDAILDFRDASGAWAKTGIAAVRTESGVICYPGLGRSVDVSRPPRRYRIRITAEFYLPFYRRFSDGIEFDAFPYNDDHPPRIVAIAPGPNGAVEAGNAVTITTQAAHPFQVGDSVIVRGVAVAAYNGMWVITTTPTPTTFTYNHPAAGLAASGGGYVSPSAISVVQEEFLTPAPNYPFSKHIPVLRGRVVDNLNRPVADAEVSRGGGLERVLTDGRGTFALPLRLEQPNVPIPIDAADHRTGRVGAINIQLPDDLGSGHTIPIN